MKLLDPTHVCLGVQLVHWGVQQGFALFVLEFCTTDLFNKVSMCGLIAYSELQSQSLFVLRTGQIRYFMTLCWCLSCCA